MRATSTARSSVCRIAKSPGAVQALAEAGKHILMEKPGAARASDFEPAARAIRAAGVAFQTGMMWRYDAGAERLRAMIADGRFGKLISIEIGQFTSDVAHADRTTTSSIPNRAVAAFSTGSAVTGSIWSPT